MAVTSEMLESLMLRLRTQMPTYAVEYFPEKPKDYRLNHSRGALLVSYIGSRFSASRDSSRKVQPRQVRLSVTLLLRQLNGREGAVAVLDDLRLALVGYRLPHCNSGIEAVDERFLGEVGGIWQYALDVSASAMQIEDLACVEYPPLQQVTHEDIP